MTDKIKSFPAKYVPEKYNKILSVEEEDMDYDLERHNELLRKVGEYGLEDEIEGYNDNEIEALVTEFEEEIAREENKDLCSYFESTRGCK